jgi:protein required for attachment to host cells
MFKKPEPVRYVLVADGGQARLLKATSRRPDAPRLVELERVERPSLHMAARELTSDIPGRVYSYSSRGRAGSGRPVAIPHGAASDFDPHAEEVQRFARRLSRRLDELRLRGQAGEFLLVVEPRFLGILRPLLRRVTRQLVAREVSGDFVHADIGRIEKALATRTRQAEARPRRRGS